MSTLSKRKICVVTGTRAEYGLLYLLLKEIEQDENLLLQLIATGMHLSPEFGSTYRLIEEDGFHIDEKVEMLLSSDSNVGITKSIGLAIIGFADVFHRLEPDIVVILGDRFEALAAAQAAMVARIPIAHIHGGEITEGAFDDAIRHAVTKFSHFHFTSAEQYRKRIIQLGEHPERVFNVGALGIDNIIRLPLLDRLQLEQQIDFTFGEVTFLVTYHPVTLDKDGPESAVQNLLDALDEFPEAKIIFTMPNSDTNSRIIFKMVEEYCNARPMRAGAYVSLGQIRYLSAMKHCTVIVGNSSSGIIEAPLMGKPTVNIGDRQKGRIRMPSIIDCSEQKQDIVISLRKALSDQFLTEIRTQKFPYGYGNAAAQIKDVLRNGDISKVLHKSFYDIPAPDN